MIPAEPSSGKAATVSTHYETLRRLLQFAEEAALNSEEIEALTALLADYEAVTAENRRLSALNERMRERLDNAIQQLSELAQPLTPALNGSYAKGEQVGYENAVRIISALRATLKGEKHE